MILLYIVATKSKKKLNKSSPKEKKVSSNDALNTELSESLESVRP